MKSKALFLILLAALICGCSKSDSSETERARQELIDAVTACGGNVQDELKQVETLHQSRPEVSYTELYKIHTASVKLKCKVK